MGLRRGSGPRLDASRAVGGGCGPRLGEIRASRARRACASVKSGLTDANMGGARLHGARRRAETPAARLRGARRRRWLGAAHLRRAATAPAGPGAAVRQAFRRARAGRAALRGAFRGAWETRAALRGASRDASTRHARLRVALPGSNGRLAAARRAGGRHWPTRTAERPVAPRRSSAREAMVHRTRYERGSDASCAHTWPRSTDPATPRSLKPPTGPPSTAQPALGPRSPKSSR